MHTNLARSLDDVPPDRAVIVPYLTDDSRDDPAWTQVREKGGQLLVDALNRGEAPNDLYETVLMPGAPPLLLVGVDKSNGFSPIVAERAASAGSRYLTRHGFHKLAVLLRGDGEDRDGIRGAIQGAIRGAYNPALFKSSRRDYTLESLTIVDPSGDGTTSEVDQGRVVGESINLARDLVNLPPNEINPTSLSERAQAVAEETGLSCRVRGPQEIGELGMGAILGVSGGSVQPPRLIELEYSGSGIDDHSPCLTWVGKGLTFDSGGLSLKTHEGMETMKGDMAGAAAVIGAMRAIGTLKPRGITVRGLIGAVENMPGGNAMKPGDVLRAFNGKTIEVLNTDAEGRLVLADVLGYAVSLGATHIVDLATLTGAAVVALGHEFSAMIGRPQDWIDTVGNAATRGLERLWQLPLTPDYRRLIDSEIADMKNIGGRWGGAITAAALLSEFVDDVPWAHLDIAGSAWTDKDLGYAVKGATGAGVATLVQLAFDIGGDRAL